MTGIATLPASIIAGILGGRAASAAFLYGAAIGFLAAWLFVIVGGLNNVQYETKRMLVYGNTVAK